MDKTIIELDKIISAETLERLQAKSNALHLSLDEVMRGLITEFVEDWDEPLEDTPDEKIIADFKEAWHQAMTGQVYPIDDLLARLRDYFAEPTDEEILQGIREGMHDALTGNTRPAREFLDGLDRLHEEG